MKEVFQARGERNARECPEIVVGSFALLVACAKSMVSRRAVASKALVSNFSF